MVDHKAAVDMMVDHIVVVNKEVDYKVVLDKEVDHKEVEGMMVGHMAVEDKAMVDKSSLVDFDLELHYLTFNLDNTKIKKIKLNL